MATRRLVSFLEQNRVGYRMAEHRATYTAMRTAQETHVKGAEMAKCVALMADGHPVLAVMPANMAVSFKRMKELMGAKEVSLIDERKLPEYFPDCETGAMPPMGVMYHMDMVADKALMRDERISFNAGTHKEIITMAFRDWLRLSHPRFADIHRMGARMHSVYGM